MPYKEEYSQEDSIQVGAKPRRGRARKQAAGMVDQCKTLQR